MSEIKSPIQSQRAQASRVESGRVHEEPLNSIDSLIYHVVGFMLLRFVLQEAARRINFSSIFNTHNPSGSFSSVCRMTWNRTAIPSVSVCCQRQANLQVERFTSDELWFVTGEGGQRRWENICFDKISARNKLLFMSLLPVSASLCGSTTVHSGGWWIHGLMLRGFSRERVTVKQICLLDKSSVIL